MVEYSGVQWSTVEYSGMCPSGHDDVTPPVWLVTPTSAGGRNAANREYSPWATNRTPPTENIPHGRPIERTSAGGRVMAPLSLAATWRSCPSKPHFFLCFASRPLGLVSPPCRLAAAAAAFASLAAKRSSAGVITRAPGGGR
eukprot:8326327-Pyramimonas_sp.AAC.2